MENFEAFNPTHIHFGKGITEKLSEILATYGNKILVMYGKGSIKKNGIYDKVMHQLQLMNAEITEFDGIKSNPIVDDVQRAAEIGKLNRIDAILAVGGGSVIDSAKITALSIANNLDPWAIMKYKAKPTKSIPLISVLTLAATGTEMNGAAVLQNHKTGEKLGYVHPLNYPKHSFLDPEFTYSVPKNYSAYGIADLIAHALEAYFGEGECSLSDRFVEAIVKEAFEFGPKVLTDPENYEYRASILWASTTALNGMTVYGKKYGDWAVHDIGHNLSLLYDTPHGATLSITYPAWLRLQSDRIPDKIIKLGNQLFGTNTINDTIEGIEKFFQSIECPIRLQDINIDKSKQEEISNQLIKTQANGMVHKLSDEDRQKIVELML